jgi:hypothetical protein
MRNNISFDDINTFTPINKNDKMKIENLAVFDLDGTLYECNSHIELLNAKYRVKFFDSIIMKIIGKLFNDIYLKILMYAYNRVPVEYIREFNIEFRASALELLKKAKNDGFHIVIISNAPKELIEAAAQRLNLEWYRAEIGCKNDIVQNKFEYKYLFVCTDNVSDINLLDLADEKYIFVTNKSKSIFCEKYPNAHFMEV